MQDGSYVGTFVTHIEGTGDCVGTITVTNMVSFDQFANKRWIQPNYTPQIATADGGLIAASISPVCTGWPTPPLGASATFDANGNQTGQLGMLPTQAWTGNTYQQGSVEQTLNIPLQPTTPPYWSFNGGNQSANGTSPVCKDDRFQLTAEYWTFKSGFIPVCQLFFSQQNWPLSAFSFSQINVSDMGSTPPAPDHPDWALAPQYFLTGLANLQTSWRKNLTISSAYRSPKVQHQYGSPHDRHIHGDAVDVATIMDSNFKPLRAAALAAGQTCVEPLANQQQYCQQHPNPTCDPFAHVHVDWRRVARPAPPPAEVCAPSWMQ
jgi:hypothetical protein